MQPSTQFSAPVSRAEDGLYLPEGASLFKRLQTAVRALKVLEKHPDDPVAAALLNAGLDGDLYRREAEALKATEFGRALLAERPTLQKGSVDLDALAKLPEGRTSETNRGNSSWSVSAAQRVWTSFPWSEGDARCGAWAVRCRACSGHTDARRRGLGGSADVTRRGEAEAEPSAAAGEVSEEAGPTPRVAPRLPCASSAGR